MALGRCWTLNNTELEECVTKCRGDRNCKESIDTLELKRYIKSITNYFFYHKVVVNLLIKGARSIVKLFIGHIIGIVADLAQFVLEYAGYPAEGKLVGAGGNTVYGVILGSTVQVPIGSVVGGAMGLGLWAYSDTQLKNNLTEVLFNK